MARKGFEQRYKTRPSEVADRAPKPQKKFADRFKTRPSPVVQALASYVRRLRKERGWSQEALAGECKLDQQSVSLIESGRANPTLMIVESLAIALDVHFADLFEAPPRIRRSNSPAK